MKQTRTWLACFALVATAFAMPVQAEIRTSDFNGDGADDLAVYHPLVNPGAWYILPKGLSPVQLGSADEYPVPGDYNADTYADAVVFNRVTGVWRGNSVLNGIFSMNLQWGYAGVWPVSGDFNGDGESDLAVYDPNVGNWYIRTRGGTALAWNLNWGFKGGIPAPGDYNGDGATDLAIYHRHTGKWYIRTLSGTVLAWNKNFGFKKGWPVPGDYNGDGATDLAVYHRAVGRWYIATLQGTAIAWGKQFGFAAAQPVPGDFNGDGKADLAVFHRSAGNWYIASVTGGAAIAWGKNWGWQGTVPLPAYAAPAASALEVVSFGDSITRGDGSSNGEKTGYPNLLEQKLTTEMGPYVRIVNAGKSGEKTWEGVNRLPTVLDQNLSDLLLLMQGTNDALYDYMFSATEPNLRFMIQSALNRQMRAVIATIPPVISNEYRNRDQQHGRIRAFNPYIFGIGSSMGIPVANVYGGITSVPNWENNLMEQESANHPNDAGYVKVRDVFYGVVRSMILTGNAYQ